ncbi:putative peptidase inhibitor 15-A-like [Scophthalmus maximus]|uniref:Putative peptidase inhibitor 15-A-like n=1 Tax=Scophthalmus maximus TaxID=52904 RepID=A0A2U9BL07_SCOMX|nr:putative peptidase inhibitor 15-A-like [Scophthalmus maximus]
MRKVHLLSCAVLLCAARGRATNSSVSPRPDSRAPPVGDGASVRRKRFIGPSDAVAILDYHNQVRANVFPPAANMEHMPIQIIVAVDQCNQLFSGAPLSSFA